MLKLAVAGAAGRMGRRIVALAKESGEFEVVAALEHSANELLGQDVGIVAGVGELKTKITTDIQTKPEVMIDFSLPESTMKWLEYCRKHRIALVIGTTGLTSEQKQAVEAAGKDIPVLLGANMSLGVNLLFKLAGQVAAALGEAYDIEIVESHHRFKRDAPSGTALELARHIAAAKQWPMPDCLQNGREGKDALRQKNTIGMHAVRAGDIVGIHQVLYSTLGETVEIHHTAHTRDTFVRGALHAAQWLAGNRPAGFYSMFDVLGL